MMAVGLSMATPNMATRYFLSFSVSLPSHDVFMFRCFPNIFVLYAVSSSAFTSELKSATINLNRYKSIVDTMFWLKGVVQVLGVVPLKWKA